MPASFPASFSRSVLILLSCLALLPLKADAAPVTVTRVAWHGWPEAIRLSNGVVEAIVVPAIGRIMAFEFVGHPETNPIFLNSEWAGKTVADAAPTTWATFGGDKLWPSPQSEWPKHNVRAWPPDQAFDGDPETAELLPDGVRLVTPGQHGLRRPCDPNDHLEARRSAAVYRADTRERF